MPKRQVLETVVLRRDDVNKGKPFAPPIGKNFNFTAAELKQLEEVRPQAFGPQIAEFVEDDDSETTSEVDVVNEGEQAPAPKPKAAAPKPKTPAKDDDL